MERSDSKVIPFKTKEMIERDFAFSELMGETIEITMEFLYDAYHSKTKAGLGVYLQLASRGLRCAMETYSDHLTEETKNADLPR